MSPSRSPLSFLQKLGGADMERLLAEAEARSLATGMGGPAARPSRRGGAEAAYADAERALLERERALREQSQVIAGMFARLRRDEAPVPQLVLRLLVGPDRIAAGRFRVRNRSSEPTRFLPQPQFPWRCQLFPEVLDVPAGGEAEATLRVLVPTGGLVADPASGLVVLRLDLVPRAGDRVIVWLELDGAVEAGA